LLRLRSSDFAGFGSKIGRSQRGDDMPYIVDGNNLMAQKPGWHRDRPKARRALLEQLARFERTKKVRITVVFDGAPDRDAPEGSAYQGVKVLYAHRGSDADSRIEELVESLPDPRGLIVVTSDRRLAFAVRTSGAKTVRSGEFRQEVERVLAGKQTEDGEDLEVGDVKGWLRYFGEESGES
jgi:predicted RNA-binding protein with PIN domain